MTYNNKLIIVFEQVRLVVSNALGYLSIHQGVFEIKYTSL